MCVSFFFRSFFFFSSSFSFLFFSIFFISLSLFLSLLISLISRDDARTNISSQRPRPGSGGIEKRTPSAHSFINIYPHLNPSGTVSSPSLPSLLSPFFSTFFFLSLSHSLFLFPLCSRPPPISEAELPGVYLFLQIFYTFRTRICIHNGRGQPEPALPSRLRVLYLPHSSLCSLAASLSVPLFPLLVMTRSKFSSTTPFLFGGELAPF